MPKPTDDHRLGVVKFFDDQKGYGFITPADPSEPEPFLHGSKLPGSGRKTIAAGTAVLYIPRPNERGVEATSIVVDEVQAFEGPTPHDDADEGWPGGVQRSEIMGEWT